MQFTKITNHLSKLVLVLTLLVSSSSFADEESDLAMQLSNPVAALISVPIDLFWMKTLDLREMVRRHRSKFLRFYLSV